MTAQQKQFTATTCGPVQFNRVAKALRKLEWHKGSTVEVHGTEGQPETHRRSVITAMFSDKVSNPRALELRDEVGERYGWEVTKENAAALAKDLLAAALEAENAAPVVSMLTSPAELDERKAANAARREAENQRKARASEAMAKLLAKKPADAAAMIIAELDVSESDSMTDYHGHRTTRTVCIGWRTGKRESFKQLREAARSFEPTKHLGPGCDVYKVYAYQADEEQRRNHPRKVMQDSRGLTREFTTDREAYEAVQVGFSCEPGAQDAFEGACDFWYFAKMFGYEIKQESVEHRENYSMGAGNYLKKGGRDCSGWGVKSTSIPSSADGAGWTVIEDGLPESDPEPAPTRGDGYEITERENRRSTFHLVALSRRVERDEFESLRDSAKAMGGWYSRKWGKCPGGFGFPTREEAQAWADARLGSDTTGEDLGHPTADRLDELADTMQEDIDAKRAPLTQNPTPRRLRIKDGQHVDAANMEQTQEALRAVAHALRLGELPPTLRGLTWSRKRVSDLVHTKSAGTPEQRLALSELVIDAGLDRGAERLELEARREKEREIENMRFEKIPGFFPTPPAAAARLVELLDVGVGHVVLEPSAGLGDLTKALLEAENRLGHVLQIEQSHKLAARLDGLFPRDVVQTEQADFMDYCPHGSFDRVAMNPPFEKRQGEKHVERAMAMLSPGGRLVAILPHNQAESLAENRSLMGGFDMDIEDMPEGSFKGPDAFKQTGARTCYLIVERDE